MGSTLLGEITFEKRTVSEVPAGMARRGAKTSPLRAAIEGLNYGDALKVQRPTEFTSVAFSVRMRSLVGQVSVAKSGQKYHTRKVSDDEIWVWWD